MSDTFFGTANPLLPPPRHLSQIGKIAATWSQIESTMEVMILGLYEIDLGRGLVFTANLSFQSRITMLHMLADGAIPDKALAKELREMLPRLEKASGERNDIVPAVWTKSEKSGHAKRLQVRVKGHKLKPTEIDYSAEDLIAIAERQYDLSVALADLSRRLGALDKLLSAPRHSSQRK
ncbi:MAG TPA: hypothetical protein VHT03_09740 [Rhizomicrobium sp.]|jgi:hypothetical protein|nr:hypothetical protein [Rhizomicrobium sp.]